VKILPKLATHKAYTQLIAILKFMRTQGNCPCDYRFRVHVPELFDNRS